VLETARPHFDLTLTMAHLNHQLRGSESQADADFVREVATQRGLPIVVETRDVAAIAAKRKQSLEEAARQVRYAFLWRVAAEVQANKIAVGHNADDQVETVLMHFLRGAGLAGLRGMLPVIEISSLRLHPDEIPASSALSSPQLIRPLLETSRSQIEAYSREHQLTPRQDTSNQDTAFFRNRLRHELIPQLETYNPNLRQTIQRTAKVVAAEVELLNDHLNQAWRSVVRYESPQKVEIDLPAWRSLPLALKRSTLRRAVQRLRRYLRDINFEHIEKARLLAEKGDVGTKATLPQELTLTMGYDTFIVAPDNMPTAPAPSDTPQLIHHQPLALNLPGVTPLPHTGWQLKAQFLTAERLNHSQVDRWETYLDADVVGSEAVLRPRRAGDTFMPLGLGGHSQKVTDFMINEKIPATWRNQIPLLVSANQILWVCGYRLDERARLRPTTRRILHLKFEPQ
jgi:tRNA(Ile)-lysidine synthase